MSTASIGFEETLWKSADKLRGSMDSAEFYGLFNRKLRGVYSCVIENELYDLIISL